VRRAAAFIVVGICLLATACDGTDAAGVARAGQTDERAELDAAWDAYVARRALFAGDEPVPTGYLPCPSGAECMLGWVIGGAFYQVIDVLPADVAVAAEVATLPDDGGALYPIDGVEPALWLAADLTDGRHLLSAEPPDSTTSRERAIELRSDVCASVAVVADGALVTEPDECGWGTVTWYLDFVDLPWDVDDPDGLADHRVWRTEPFDDVAAAALGAPLAYATEQAALGDLDEQLCGARSGCEVTYEIGARTDTRTTVTVTTVEIDTFRWRRVLERLDDGRWWWAEDGPLAVE